jgi:hypothetical protein
LANESFDYILFDDIDDTFDMLQAPQNLTPLCRETYAPADNHL